MILNLIDKEPYEITLDNEPIVFAMVKNNQLADIIDVFNSNGYKYRGASVFKTRESSKWVKNYCNFVLIFTKGNISPDKKIKSILSKSEVNEITGIKVEEIKIIYPFDTPDFLSAWELWKKFKKEQFNFKYKSIGEQSALLDLSEMANGDPEKAIAIIKKSISKGWQGLFPLTHGKQITNNNLADAIKRNYERQHGNTTGSI